MFSNAAFRILRFAAGIDRGNALDGPTNVSGFKNIKTHLLKAVYEPKYRQPTMETMMELVRCALNGTPNVGCIFDKNLGYGKPLSLAKDQQRRDCHVWLAIRHPNPVLMMSDSRTIAPALVLRAR